MGNYLRLEGELLKELQKTELSILKDVASFCEDNGIRYCISSGTLLGAVRHGGFIPWDDDIDISMPRQDYEKFLSLAKNLPPIYVCESTIFNPNYPIAITKVRKKGTVMKEPSMEHLDISHGVWIDIFPLDKVKNLNNLSKRAHSFNLLTTAINYKLGVSLPKKVTTKLFCRILKLFSVRHLDKWRTKVMTAEENSNGKYFTSFASNLGPNKLLFEQEIYFPLKKIQFEDSFFYAPADSHKWLTGAYGDYLTLPPQKNRVNRHSVSEIKL